MVRANWPVLCAVAFSLIVWAGVADAGYRAEHHGHGGLRHALYAHAVRFAHGLERLA